MKISDSFSIIFLDIEYMNLLYHWIHDNNLEDIYNLQSILEFHKVLDLDFHMMIDMDLHNHHILHFHDII